MSNTISLDQETADRLRVLKKNERTGVRELAVFAADIRNQNLNDAGSYTGEFQKFWKANELDEVFGSKANFTRYAGAGDVLAKFDALYSNRVDRLPDAVSTLYEISQLTNEELKLCVEDTYARNEVTDDTTKWRKVSSRVPKPLISRDVSAADVRNWRNRWRSPTKKSTDTRRVPLLEIKIDNSIYDFEDGVPSGKITISELEAFIAQIEELASKLNQDHYLVNVHGDAIIETYKAKQQAKPKAKSVVKKKSSVKKR